MDKLLEIYIDGSCLGNPGYGGWASLFYKDDSNYVYSLGGKEFPSTNNRMELTAFINTLYSLSIDFKEYNDIRIFTDSAYVYNIVNKKLYLKWKRENNDTVKNYDLISILYFLLTNNPPNFKLIKVKGHAGNCKNEQADKLAKSFSKACKEHYIKRYL